MREIGKESKSESHEIPSDAELYGRGFNDAKEQIRSKLLEIRELYGCSDNGCIYGHPGGMGTNGGCVSLKGGQYQVRKELSQLAGEIKILMQFFDSVQPRGSKE